MEIRITFLTMAFVLLFNDITLHKQINKVSLTKEYLDKDGEVWFAKIIFNFGIQKKYKKEN